MKRIIGLHVDEAKAGQPTALCLPFYGGSAHEQFKKYDEVLDHVDRLIRENKAVTLRYATVSAVRDKFLRRWQK